MIPEKVIKIKVYPKEHSILKELSDTFEIPMSTIVKDALREVNILPSIKEYTSWGESKKYKTFISKHDKEITVRSMKIIAGIKIKKAKESIKRYEDILLSLDKCQ